MKQVLLIHISDLHIATLNSPAVTRLGQLAGAIGSLRSLADDILLLISGDIAYHGYESEYEIAFDVLTGLDKRLREEWNFDDIKILICPGNHDCNFSRVSDGVRDALLDGLETDLINQIQIIQSLAVTQEEFNNFSDAISHPVKKINPVLSIADVQCGGRNFNIEIVNTAWSSRIKEKPGSLRMPAETIPSVDLDANVSIALLHHPLNWYTPQDGKDLSDWLDVHSDIAMWGHEHRADDFAIRRKRFGSTVFHMLAMPIDDDTVQCGFRAIVIHPDDRMDVHPFEWKGARFEKIYHYTEQLPKNPARELGQVRFTREFKLFLQDPGAKFKHPRVDRSLSLADIFVEPGFKVFNGGLENVEKIDFSVPLADVCNDIKTLSDVAIYAPEQAGKTTFAKYIIEDARHQGITALYFDVGKLRSANRGDVTGWIKSAIRFQYESDCHSLIEQLEPKKIIVVVDNVHQLPGSSSAVKDIIDRIKILGSKIVYFTAQNPAITLLAANQSSGEEVRLWSDAKWYELLPLNNVRRAALIRRWSALGRDELADRERIEVEVRQAKIQLDRVLGKNFMPKYPFFLLALLQQMENSKDTNSVINNASQGHIFQALITAALESSVKSHEIGIIQDFLSRVAFEIWSASATDISINGFARLISDFKREALVAILHPQLLDELIQAGILLRISDLISFRYNYFYYFFLARWLSAHRESPEANKFLDQFVENIHTEMSVNVVMFVTHFGHEDWVLGNLMPLANELFRGVPECNLASHAVLAAKYSEESNHIVLISGDAEVVSNHHHEQEDSVGHGDGPESMEDAFQFNTAIRTIQALGQVLRSRAGAISGEDKIKIAKATTSLARRLMSRLYDVAEQSAESLVENVSELFETEVKVDSKEAENFINKLISAIIGGIAKSIVARASEVMAAPDLLPLIERLEEIHAKDEVLDNQIVFLVARVIAEKDYPRERVEGMLKRIREADILTHAALAHSVVRSFYLNPPPRAVRDSACAKLGIKIEKIPHLLRGDQGGKVAGTNRKFPS